MHYSYNWLYTRTVTTLWPPTGPDVPGWKDGLYWDYRVVTEPVEEPLDLKFVRDMHLRVATGTAENTYIEHLIRVARRQAEYITRRSLMRQTRSVVVSGFPGTGWIELPFPPILEVESITYLADGSPDVDTLDADLYQVIAPQGPQAQKGRISFGSSSLPSLSSETLNAVTITYTAGYEDTSVSPAEANVPDDLKHGMLLLIGEMYKVRGMSVHAIAQHEAMLSAHHIFLGYRVY